MKLILKTLGKPESLIPYVKDRPGHDRRYGPDPHEDRARARLASARELRRGDAETIRWYDSNGPWLDRVRSGEYRNYYERHYGERLRAPAPPRNPK